MLLRTVCRVFSTVSARDPLFEDERARYLFGQDLSTSA